MQILLSSNLSISKFLIAIARVLNLFDCAGFKVNFVLRAHNLFDTKKHENRIENMLFGAKMRFENEILLLSEIEFTSPVAPSPITPERSIEYLAKSQN